MDHPNPATLEKFKPFMDEILNFAGEKIQSITMTGSALTDDFIPGQSDINSIVVLSEFDTGFLELLAPLGKKYRKKMIAAPLIMTLGYIKNSLDVFPIEFFNIKLIHNTVFGEDLFYNIDINRSDLRIQCERELKVKLIGLRQGYIASTGHVKALAELFINSISGYIPLFRCIIFLLENDPPVNNKDVLAMLKEAAKVHTAVFQSVLDLKKNKTKLPVRQLNAIFGDYYEATEKLGNLIDELQA